MRKARMRLVIIALALSLAPWTLRALQDKPAVQRVVSMEYPPLARMAHLQSEVKLRARISSDGTVDGIVVISGPEPLATPARQDIAKWHFSGCLSSVADCTIEIDFSFVLEGTCSDSPRCATDFQVDLPNKVLVKSQVFGKVLP